MSARQTSIHSRDSNNPRSSEELQHDIEQIVTDTAQRTLRKVARNTLKGVDAGLKEGGGHFQHLL
jgi:hypothetical protein